MLPRFLGRDRLLSRLASVTLLVALSGVARAQEARTQEGSPPVLAVYEGAAFNGVGALQKSFIPWFGRAPDMEVEFVDFSGWAAFDRALDNGAGYGIQAWKGKVANLVISMPLTMQNVPLSDVAAGAGDAHFLRAAKLLVANGFPKAIVRLGWEMNAGWYPWGNLTDDAKVASYKAAFAHVVGLFRSVSKDFRIDWCPAGGWMQVPQPNLYPGDQYVDIVGTDLYAAVWGVNHPTTSQVEGAWNHNWSLDWVANFAKAHGKPFSLPEFGVGDRPNGNDNYGPGDDPEAMTYALQWMRQRTPPRGQSAGPGQLTYLGLWDYDAGDYNSKLSTGERPKTAAAFKAGMAAGSGRVSP